MLTPALDKVQRWAPAYADNGVRTYGFMVHSDVDHWMDETHVRAAYALDIAAAVAEARKDERRRVFHELTDEIERTQKSAIGTHDDCHCGDCVLDHFREWVWGNHMRDAAQPAPGKEGTP
jgi:hypothetical protein